MGEIDFEKLFIPRRVKACLDACKGIETEVLEGLGEDGVYGMINEDGDRYVAVARFASQQKERADEAEALLDQIWSRIEAAEFEDIENDDDLVVVTFEAAFARKIRAFLDKHGKEQG